MGLSPQADVSDTVAAEAMCDAEILNMRPGPGQGHVTRAVPEVTRRKVFSRACCLCLLHSPPLHSRWHLGRRARRRRGGQGDRGSVRGRANVAGKAAKVSVATRSLAGRAPHPSRVNLNPEVGHAQIRTSLIQHRGVKLIDIRCV